jgi:gamma-glutamylcyclotransferase (GGCT)/AIG2-like uncharacterized protein YtfP
LQTFYFFKYGPLPGRDAEALLEQATHAGVAYVGGTVYDIDGEFPALMLYGETEVRGDVLQCNVDSMPRVDLLDCITSGTLRRVATTAISKDGSHLPCWILVAGPAIAHKLTPQSRIPHH